MTFIIDAHQDIAYNSLTFSRNFRLSAQAIREKEKDTPIPAQNGGEATLGWEDYQRGKIAVIFSTIFLTPRKYNGGAFETQTYASPKEARPLLMKQMDLYREWSDDGRYYQLIQNQADLARVLQPWQENEPGNHPVGLILLLEGAEGLGDPSELEEYYAMGLRIVGPVWSGIRYMGGTDEDRPFDTEGRKLLEVMSDLNLPMDISHMREHAALTAMDHYEGLVLAGHAACRAINKVQTGERQLTDLTIRRLIEHGGVMGILPYNSFLVTDWNPSLPRESVTINDIILHIDHVCQLAGDSKHAAIGSDFDGGFGFPQIPLEMDTVADLQKIKPALAERGYSDVDITNIFNQNWLDLLERSLPK